MTRTGHFTAFALCVLLGGCSSDARIKLFEPPLENQPPDEPAMDGGAAGSDGGQPPPMAGTGVAAQAGSSGRRSGSSTAGRSGSSGSAGAAGTTRPPRTPVEDAGPPRSAADPIPGLILRYDFTGDGTTVPDLVGDADATLVGGAVVAPDGDSVLLDGVDDYVDMPNGIVSALDSATFVAWIAWNGGPCWQRVFDFGSNEGGEDASGTVRTSLFMTPVACGREDFAVMAEFGRIQYQLFADRKLPIGSTVQVALVVDGYAERHSFTMYLNGVALAGGEVPFALSDFIDNNNWLGRSQWPQDRYLAAYYGDFRIYDRALDPDEMAILFSRGPNGL